MFGRIERTSSHLAGDRQVAAVLHAYSPQRVAGALAAATARAPLRVGPGNLVRWGRRAQRLYVRLPGKVLTIVTPDAVLLYEWTVRGAGPRVARWPAGTYAATQADDLTELGVRVMPDDGTAALLSGPRGLTRHAVRGVITGITSLARGADSASTRHTDVTDAPDPPDRTESANNDNPGRT